MSPENGQKTTGMGRKAVGVALGLGVLKRTMGTFRSLLWNDASRWGYESTRDSIQQIRAMGKEGVECRSETFLEAKERLSLTEADLGERLADLKLQGVFFRVLGYVSLAAGVISGGVADTFFWFFLLTLNGLSVSAMFFSICFVRFFRAWQIEEKSLASMREFIRAGGIYRAFF